MSTGLAPALEYHVVNSLGWPDLRELQRAAVDPIRRGNDCLLLAPTAGGKTEAAFFPLLSQMAEEPWSGLSVLYVTPLRALLNNLHPRLSGYASWLGRGVGLWHGDVGDGDRRRMLAEPPDVLLTTPESLEAMLVSTRVDHRFLFAHVQAVVVDELHAFAGDDRGWHLLSVLERVQHLADRRLQRVGLSATVGNPEELLTWLAGGTVPVGSSVIAPAAEGLVEPEVTLDYVGSIENAAVVVSRLHRGEKRLVFCDSRAQTEELAQSLRARDIETFVSHSSLSAEERRLSEQAFAESPDCVVVATSTLELGIDVGDLDRVVQLDAPRTVASFLQRIGRTGRRPGTSRNALFLATREQSLLQAAGLLALWGTGFVEPVVPPSSPRHIAAQQLLALALQEGRFGAQTWQEWWVRLSVMDGGEEILSFLRENGFLESDGDLLFIGPAAEAHFGRRNFMDLTAVFTAEPELTVLHGRREIGSVSPLALTGALPAGEPRVLALGGRAWMVSDIDWRARRVSVSEQTGTGRSRWQGGGPSLSLPLARAMRSVLLGDDPPVELSQRAVAALERVRSERAQQVDESALVLARRSPGAIWWTWAGTAANASLAAALEQIGVAASADAFAVTVEADVSLEALRGCSELLASDHPAQPIVDQDALDGLKFSAALPPNLAADTMVRRMTDPIAAARVAAEPLLIC